VIDTSEYSLLMRDVIFLDEKPIQLYGQHTPGYIAFEAHTALMTPQQCFEACMEVARPLRYFNLYPTTDGGQVCSCVETFTGLRAQPGALVHGVCVPDDDLGPKLKVYRQHILPGRHFRLKVTVAGGKRIALHNSDVDAAVSVALPPQVVYKSSRTLPPLRSVLTGRKVGPTLNNSALVWDRVPVSGKRKRFFMINLRTRADTPPGTSLHFEAAVLLRPPVQGLLPYCANPSRNNATTIVVARGRRGVFQ
jgi:hypothetical protein